MANMADDVEYLDENFAIELTDKCDTEEQWLGVMRFGMTELLKKPKVLMECIARRATRLKETSVIPSKCVADFAAELMGKLNLRFVLCDSRPPQSS